MADEEYIQVLHSVTSIIGGEGLAWLRRMPGPVQETDHRSEVNSL